DTGCSGDRVPERRLAMITSAVSEADANGVERVARSAPVPSSAPPIAKIAPSYFTGLIGRKAGQHRVIALAEYPRAGSDDQTDFYIVERKPGAVLKPYMMGDAPAITVKAGTTEEWVIENWTHELH